jgi:hypothetical protein
MSADMDTRIVLVPDEQSMSPYAGQVIGWDEYEEALSGPGEGADESQREDSVRRRSRQNAAPTTRWAPPPRNT